MAKTVTSVLKMLPPAYGLGPQEIELKPVQALRVGIKSCCLSTGWLQEKFYFLKRL